MPKTPSKYLDLYAILSCTRKSTPAEIKKAYRNLCKLHHPDVGGDEEDFVRIHTAYAVLMDRTSRKKYDETGKYDNEQLQEDHSVLATSLVGLFKATITSGQHYQHDVDLIKSMRDAVEKRIAEVTTAISKNLDMLQSLRMLDERITPIEGKEGIFVDVLHVQINHHEKEEKKLEQLSRVTNLLDEELQRYTCATEMVHSMRMFTIIGSVTHGTDSSR